MGLPTSWSKKTGIRKAIKNKLYEKNEAKEIFEAELKHFVPQLSKYSPNQFIKIIGPLAIGIELIPVRFSKDKTPCFTVYFLWGNRMGNDLKACLSYPAISKEFRTPKGFRLTVPFSGDKSYLVDSVKGLKTQFILPFDRDVYLEEVLDAIEKSNEYMHRSQYSFLHAIMEGNKMKMALYFSKAHAILILNDIRSMPWNKKHFELWGVNVNDWINELEQFINERELFLKQILLIKSDRRLKKITSSEILLS